MKNLLKRLLGTATGNAGSPAGGDRLAFLGRLDEGLETRLSQIPSQTSPGERRMLYQFFSQFWTGHGDVIEIGPFLGGTSRAIALGMLHNPRRQAGKLYTYDRFKDYFEVSRLASFLKPLVENGVLTLGDVESLGDRAEFIEIFKRIHQGEDYYACLQPSDNGVPDLPEQVATGPWMQLPEGLATDAIFIDGCKSWFGTKYFMKLVAPSVRPGAMFLFQDYGWFTCFWLPAFTACFADALKLCGNVGNTYVFSLTRDLTAEEIESRFSDSPERAKGQFASWFEMQIGAAKARNDAFAHIRHTMHYAAAMAYVGEMDRASNLMTEAENLPQAPLHRLVLAKAWRSPTYTPTEEVLLRT